jgi:MFS family permease
MRISPGLGRAAVLVGVAIAFADASIVVLAVPDVINQLDVSVAASSWVITAYNVAVVVAGALLIPAVGRFAPRRLAAIGFAAFALAALGCAAAPSFGVLVGFRTVQGLAAALVLVSALPLLGGRAGVRAWTLAATIGLAAGPALGGLLTELFSWRAIFAVQAPVAALGLLALARLTPGERAAPGGKRPRASWLADACLAALSAALVGALFLVVLLLISGFGWQPFPAALVATTLPVLALAADRLGRGLPAGAAVSGGALLVACGLVVLGFLPGPETALVVAGLALCGTGLGLASQPLGLLALDGPSLPHDAAWTVVARHVGLVLALAAVTPVLVSSLDKLENDAEAVGGEVVLRAPLPLQEKVPLLLELADVADTAEVGLPDIDETFARHESGNGVATAVGERLTATLKELIAHSFRPAFLLCAAFGLVAAALGLALGPVRRRARAPALALLGVAAAVAVVAVAAEVNRGALDDPAAVADPCRPAPPFRGEGVDATIQRVALGALGDAACELDTSRAALLRGLTGDGPSPWPSNELEAAVRTGVVDTIDRERERGTIDGTLALFLRALVAAAPLDWIRGALEGLQN